MKGNKCSTAEVKRNDANITVGIFVEHLSQPVPQRYGKGFVCVCVCVCVGGWVCRAGRWDTEMADCQWCCNEAESHPSKGLCQNCKLVWESSTQGPSCFLDNAPSQPQDLNFAHLNIQVQYLYNSTTLFMQPFTTSRGITYTTVSTVSQMHLKMRRLLVSMHAGDCTAQLTA
jgi:hypothetical protein